MKDKEETAMVRKSEEKRIIEKIAKMRRREDEERR